MKLRSFLVGSLLAISCADEAFASWASQITGVSVDLSTSTVRISTPDLQAIPLMVQNLPKDLSQAIVNPYAPAVAAAIRNAKAQALSRDPKSIPANIRAQLDPYFPQYILDRVRWSFSGNGFSLDNAILNWFQQEGAITLDSVIVFSGDPQVSDLKLWAHELTHVMQYENMGIDSFAFTYLVSWASLEQQASDNATLVMRSITAKSASQPDHYSFAADPGAFKSQTSWSQFSSEGKKAIDPRTFIWIRDGYTGNDSPATIVVTGVVMQNLFTGEVTVQPCNQPTCVFAPFAEGPLLSPPGYVITGVTAAYELP